ncbi:MAG: DUF4837 family protein [Saprospiraceae bacterium]
MKSTFIHCIFLLFIVIVVIGCDQNSNNPYATKPLAIGKINKLDIIIDPNLLNNGLKDTIESIFESPYPVLPAYEPIFNLRFLTYQDLQSIKYIKNLRTYLVIANVSDTASHITKMLKEDIGTENFHKALKDSTYSYSVGTDKWARGQLIIYIFGKNIESITNTLTNKFNAIAKRINIHDNESLNASIYGATGENKVVNDLILNKFGFNIRIPKNYVVAIDDDNFLWLRFDNKIAIQSLVIEKFPYHSEKQWSVDSIIALRNAYGKKYITTEQKNAFMITNTEDLPTFDFSYEHHGFFMREVRGIWETENDFKGGPYISYVIHNSAKNEIIFIDAFVFAPGEDKRDLMQQLDHIVKTVTIPGVENK